MKSLTDVETEEKLPQSKIICSLSDLCPWILLDLCDMQFKEREKSSRMVVIENIPRGNRKQAY